MSHFDPANSRIFYVIVVVFFILVYCILFRINNKSYEAPELLSVPRTDKENSGQHLIQHNQLPENLKDRKLAFHEVYEPRAVSFVDYHYTNGSNSTVSPDTKVILMWTPWNGLWETINYYHLRFGSESFSNFDCPNQKCIVTKDEKALEHADAVFFYLLDIDRRDKFPPFRKPNQKWILYIMEAPWQVGINMDKLRSLFNWTMSYREDSDIVAKYGFVGKRPVPLPNGTEIFPKGSLTKKKSVVWFVSDCKTESRREEYVRQLKRHIDVDIYGLCGHMKCFPSQSDLCYQRVLKNYKFYLSFENSICKDYVTEKFFNVLTYNIVPVVFGGANYSQLSPPGSYIDATSFPNPRDLAQYLRKVGEDEELYGSFLSWKREYGVYLHPWMCYLCDKLHQPTVSTVRDDVKKWWIKDSVCKRWTDNFTFEDVVR